MKKTFVKTSFRHLFIAGVLLSSFPLFGVAETYKVTNLNDAGAGSLREAIDKANKKNKSVIEFEVDGTIVLSSPLPSIQKQVTIDGTTAPSFTNSPAVCVDFSGNSGLVLSKSADKSEIKALSFIHASNSAITIRASEVTVAGNYIGVNLNHAVAPNEGDGVKLTSSSKGNLIGNFNPVKSQNHYTQLVVPSESTPNNPVTLWQGLRKLNPPEQGYMISGASFNRGLLYLGALNGASGASYLVQYPDSESTVAYGPNDTGTVDGIENKILQLVGSYRNNGEPADVSHGFLWSGTASDLPSGGVWRTIDYPDATYQCTQSVMGGLAVGSAYIPGKKNKSKGRFVAYIYSLGSNNSFAERIVFPSSKSNMACGIWHNGSTKYTICGGYSTVKSKELSNKDTPQRHYHGYLVDYNSKTGEFSNWKSFDFPNGKNSLDYITFFKGISSTEPGVYSLCANSVAADKNGDPSSEDVMGSLVMVRREPDNSFSPAYWIDIQDPDSPAKSSCNSVYQFNLVGTNFSSIGELPYQATVNFGFQLSNVISGNRGNGIKLSGSKGNIISMNYIGSNPMGSGNQEFKNGKNGILLTSKSSENLIGGEFAGDNNPTGSKGTVTPIFFRPPQGNLISGNELHGVLIEKSSSNNLLVGNYIGTDGTGANPLGNGKDGVKIKNSNHNSLVGCTLRQNPFVFYNVISGNTGDGIHLENANHTAVQGNFIGINCSNSASLANGGNGLTVAGTSKDTQVGGVIPLGNVISGNSQNGIAVIDKASGFITFNTFAGILAFGGVAPNGQNGLLVTSTGGDNIARTNIISGNNWNGVEISGEASGVQVMDTACGISTNFRVAIPNGRHGILIGGKAHDNKIGGFRASIELKNHLAGNIGYGIYITDFAHNNHVFGSDIGTALGQLIPNNGGGIFLDQGTSATTIGGKRSRFGNKINGNDGAGIIISGSRKNRVLRNQIQSNTEFGIYAEGNCRNTRIKNNTVENNGDSSVDNVQIDDAKGIIYIP